MKENEKLKRSDTNNDEIYGLDMSELLQDEQNEDDNSDEKNAAATVETKKVTKTVEFQELKQRFLDSTDPSIQLLTNLRAEFLKLYPKFKFLLIFDKSKDKGIVSYYMINPIDNCTLLPKPFQFKLPPTKDIMFYRVVELDQKIYIIGGISMKSNRVLPQAYVYDVSDDSWKECARLNVPRCKFSVSIIKGRIHVIGGQDVFGTPLTSVEYYDHKHDVWVEAGHLNKGRKFHASSVLDDKYLFVTGGAKMPTDSYLIHDIDSGEWKAGVNTFDLPCERENHASIIHNNTLYLFGGLRYYSKTNDEDDIEPINENSIHSMSFSSYNLVKNNTWKTLSHPKTIEDRNGLGVCALGKYIYIIGGHTVENYENLKAVESKLIERFDTRTNRIEPVFKTPPEVSCFDVDCCIVEIDPTKNKNFDIDALFLRNYVLW